MSASKHLRQLFTGDETARDYTLVRHVLPLIADCIEAAEKVDAHIWNDGERLDPEVFGLRIASLGNALVALDTSLVEGYAGERA